MNRRIFATFLMLGQSICCSIADELDMRVQRGEALASRMCAQCHAIHRTDQSPHDGAPEFRRLEQRLDLDSFMDRLRQGLTSGHPDMPTFEIGPQMDILLFKVAFKPGKSLNPISDEWGNIEIEGEALANDLGKFGTWTVRE
jgi:cytochrome c